MTIVTCPRCRDEVTVPAKAKPSALVRCPLCREEYRLAEALDQLPPALVVLDAMEDEEEALVGAGVASEYRVAEEGAGGYADAFQTPGPTGMAAATAPTTATPQFRAKPRPKRKEKSAIGEMVKVVLGGVVGLTAAMLILWWGFHRDPLEIGPKVAEYAPWIVPAKLHGKPPAAKPGTANSMPDSSGPSTIANSGGPGGVLPDNSNGSFDPEGKFQNALAQNPQDSAGGAFGAADAAPNPPAVDPTAPMNDAAVAGAGGLTIDDPLKAFQPDNDKPAPKETDPLSTLDAPPSLTPLEPLPTLDMPAKPGDAAATADEPATTEPPAKPEPAANSDAPAKPDQLAKVDIPTKPEPAAPETAKPETAKPEPETAKPDTAKPEPTKPEPAPSDTPAEPAAPTVTAPDVAKAVSAVNTTREAFDNSVGQPREVRQELATAMYDTAAKLGPLLVQTEIENADYVDVMKSASEALSALGQPSKVSMVGYLAAQRLDTPKAGPGVLLVGKVKDFKSVGSLYETIVELGGRAPRDVSVVSETNPQDSFKIGTPIVVVGRIVRDIKAELPHYGGEASLVVEQGHAIAAPAE